MIIKGVFAIAATALLTVSLAACGESEPCKKGHYIYIPITTIVGKIPMVTLTPIWQCDIREKGK